MKNGPYIDEVDSKIFFPLDEYEWNEAQVEAGMYARDTMGWDWGRVRYEGKRVVGCHNHDEPWDGGCCQRMAYIFEVYEK